MDFNHSLGYPIPGPGCSEGGEVYGKCSGTSVDMKTVVSTIRSKGTG